jgi:site-specific recombinase XerC
MTRGRKRQHDPTIPAHIDQNALPRGVYWDRSGSGHWYAFETGPDGKRLRRKIASASARVSELHALIEDRAGVDRESLAWLLDQYHGSQKFKAQSPRTQRDRKGYRKVVLAYQTRIGPLGGLAHRRLTTASIQRIIDNIAESHPTKANHIHRYLRLVFSWGIRRGHCAANPARGVEQAKERRQRAVPTVETMERVIAFARVRGCLKAHTKGSVSPYLWFACELAYLCRLRGVELFSLTDACETSTGLAVERAKGSRGNVVRWTPRLRAAWDAALAYRARVVPASAPVPIDPEKRGVLVTESGSPLAQSSFESAWQRMILAAISAGIITPEQRFAPHAFKHRGITDTPGNRADKQQASGHKSASMLDIYDHEIPTVDPAGES